MTMIGYQSATDLATELIRKRILDGPLDPGSRVNPADLASEFGLSRTPVRDALARLQTEGLVEIVPRVGIYVRRIQASEVREIYSIKGALEPMIARWATERASLERRKQWAASAAGLGEIAKSGDVDAYLALVVKRRLDLIEMAESPVLAEVFRMIDGRVRTLRDRNLNQPVRMRASVREHESVAKAVAAGDPDAAYERQKKHVEAAQSGLMRLLNEQAAQDKRTKEEA